MTARATRLLAPFMPVASFVLASLAWSAPAAAQTPATRFQLGAQLAVARSGEFDTSDPGIGVRGSWHPSAMFGLEGEINLYPRDLTDNPTFSGQRVEGLFGATIGPQLGKVRPFGRARAGFLRFGAAPEPLGCIAIFPPPLSCTLAAGKSLLALDLGGGIEVSVTSRTFWRIDVGDRLVRYPGPTLDRNFRSRDSFFGHDFRFAAGAGLRF